MTTNFIKFEEGAMVPDYVNFDTTETCALAIDHSLIFFIQMCEGEKDANSFKKSDISCFVNVIDSIPFFIFWIKDCQLIFDTPYNFSLLPENNTIFPIEDFYLFFVDDNNIIQAMRGLSLSSDKLTTLLQATKSPTSTDEYFDKLDAVYEKYTDSKDMIGTALEIKWLKKNEKKS